MTNEAQIKALAELDGYVQTTPNNSWPQDKPSQLSEALLRATNRWTE